MKLKTRPKVLDDEPLVKAVDADTDESTAYEDHVVVMPPKSITTIRMRIEYVRKALPPIIDPIDS
jgi:hypothetical protein